MSAVLEVRDIAKSFGGVQRRARRLLRRAARARSSASSGPNGSGKSTLFNCILGQLVPDARRRSGSTAATSPACAPRASTAWASAAPSSSCRSFPQLTVRENLILAGQEHRARGSAACSARATPA